MRFERGGWEGLEEDGVLGLVVVARCAGYFSAVAGAEGVEKDVLFCDDGDAFFCDLSIAVESNVVFGDLVCHGFKSG